MSPERFDHLFSLVGPLISKLATRFRNPISPSERLAVTLRYLATGDSQHTSHSHLTLELGSQLFRISFVKLVMVYVRHFLKNILLHQKALKIGNLLQRDFKMNGTSPIALEPLMVNIFAWNALEMVALHFIITKTLTVWY